MTDSYTQKCEEFKARKIAELLADIESLRHMKDGDTMPDGREFVARRLPRYLKVAGENLAVAQTMPARQFAGTLRESERILFLDDFRF